MGIKYLEVYHLVIRSFSTDFVVKCLKDIRPKSNGKLTVMLGEYTKKKNINFETVENALIDYQIKLLQFEVVMYNPTAELIDKFGKLKFARYQHITITRLNRKLF